MDQIKTWHASKLIQDGINYSDMKKIMLLLLTKEEGLWIFNGALTKLGMTILVWRIEFKEELLSNGMLSTLMTSEKILIKKKKKDWLNTGVCRSIEISTSFHNCHPINILI